MAKGVLERGCGGVGWGGGQEAIFLIRGQEQELQMYIHVNCSQDPQKPDKMASQIHCPQEIVKITMDLRSKPPLFPGQQRREVGGGGEDIETQIGPHLRKAVSSTYGSPTPSTLLKRNRGNQLCRLTLLRGLVAYSVLVYQTFRLH
jgi:hypothetical protein